MRLLLRSAAAGTHVPCQNTLLLQNEKSLVPKLPRMVLKYLWSTSGFCNRNLKASYKYSVHTVHVILAGSLFAFFLSFFCPIILYWVGLIDDTQKQALFVLYIKLYFRQLAKSSNSGFCVFSKNKSRVSILVHKHQWYCRG